MKITVTAQDIAEGRPCAGADCPIALALVRAGVQSPTVFDSEIIHRLLLGDQVTVAAPSSVAKFVTQFDNATTRASCVPFEFEIDL